MGLGSRLRLFWTAGKGVVTGLSEATELSDPFELFENWFTAAGESGILLPESMGLSTATRDGRPSSRMVLLKAYGPDGFVFYTNFGSQKASEMDDNPHAALLFHWAVLQRQIRIEGTVERLSSEESRRYFRTRGRGSRISAWASKQSEPLHSREHLEERFRRIQKKFDGEDVSLPDFWGGYRLVPTALEFWQGRINRLHDRIRFNREFDAWSVMRLYP